MTLILNDIDNELNVSPERVMEYANNRILANPKDGFTPVKNIKSAKFIIEVYGELALDYNMGDKVKIKEETYFKINKEFKNEKFFIVKDFGEYGYILATQAGKNIGAENNLEFTDEELED